MTNIIFISMFVIIKFKFLILNDKKIMKQKQAKLLRIYILYFYVLNYSSNYFFNNPVDLKKKLLTLR